MTDFQSMAVEQGQDFQRICVASLVSAGFEISDPVNLRVDDVGVEVDIVATGISNLSFLFECKGARRHSEKSRPGLERTDTIKKALCNAVLLRRSEISGLFPPLVILTSHVPRSGAGVAMLCAMGREDVFDIINPIEHAYRLMWLSRATEEEIKKDMADYSIGYMLQARWGSTMPKPVQQRQEATFIDTLPLFAA